MHTISSDAQTFGLLCEHFPSDEQYLTIQIELVVGLLSQTGLCTNGGSGKPATVRLIRIVYHTLCPSA